MPSLFKGAYAEVSDGSANGGPAFPGTDGKTLNYPIESLTDQRIDLSGYCQLGLSRH